MPSKNSLEDDDTTSTAAAATNYPPSTGVRPHTRALGPPPPLDTLVDNLFKMLDDRFTKMDDRFAELTSSMDKGEKRQVESMSHLEDRLLAKIEAFNGQIGDLRTNAIDHERRINDQDQRINKLKSNLLKLESVHKSKSLISILCSLSSSSFAVMIRSFPSSSSSSACVISRRTAARPSANHQSPCQLLVSTMPSRTRLDTSKAYG